MKLRNLPNAALQHEARGRSVKTPERWALFPHYALT